MLFSSEKQQKTNQRRKNLTQDQSRKQQIFLVSRRPIKKKTTEDKIQKYKRKDKNSEDKI
jgi:hypothetical protein